MSSSSSSSRQHRDSSSVPADGASESLVHIKFLLPGTTTGSVIGKGGERIASLQRDTNTKMKMSKAGDYFPGTQERVCLVIGTIGNVLSVHDFLGEKIQESFPGDVLRARQIKLLIPNGTAGVIIGKGGSTIENIKQDTTASLTITPKSEMPERVMTITGDEGVGRKALEMVLHKILEDPHHDSIASVNYSSEKTFPSNSYAHGSSHQGEVNLFNDHPSAGKSNGLMSTTSSSYVSLQLSGLQRLSQLLISAGGANHLTVDSLFNTLQSLGFADVQVHEIVQSIGTLINHGLITVENFSRPTLSMSSYSSSQRDRSEHYSRNSTDMDSKRFKSDQQRSTKSKR